MFFIRFIFFVPLIVCLGVLFAELTRRVQGRKRPTPTWRSVVHFCFFFAVIYAVFLYFVMAQINSYVPAAS